MKEERMEPNKQASIESLLPAAKDKLSNLIDKDAGLATFQNELEELLNKSSGQADRIEVISILVQKNLNEIQQQFERMLKLARLKKPAHGGNVRMDKEV